MINTRIFIGILIALQVNNWNNARTDRKREIKYLSNIILDLKKDIASLDYLIAFRNGRLISDQELIQQINEPPIKELTAVTKNVVNSLMEERFSPNNSTFNELESSGNLSLISNDSIKVYLLELNEIYKMNEFGIAHEEFDYREYISRPLASYIKLDKMYPIFTGEKTAEEQNITAKDFNGLFKSQEYQNGLVILASMHNAFISAYESIKSKSNRVIEMIEKDIET